MALAAAALAISTYPSPGRSTTRSEGTSRRRIAHGRASSTQVGAGSNRTLRLRCCFMVWPPLRTFVLISFKRDDIPEHVFTSRGLSTDFGRILGYGVPHLREFR